jgi:hypothetical protein
MQKLLKLFFATALFMSLFLIKANVAQAASPSPKVTSRPAATATLSAQPAIATPAGEISTPSATIQQKSQENDNDITDTTSKSKDKLTQILDEHPVGPLSWHNFLQHGIRRAINQGLPANFIVLMLLFPLITSIISFSRHIIGLKGFGVYTPAVLSVAFVSTGVVNGIGLFVIILVAGLLMRKVLQRLNLQYLPRTAMLFWGISILSLAVMIAFSYVPNIPLLTINIFPVLIIILLTENFMESQLSSSQSEAIEMTLETLVTAIFCSLLIGAQGVQQYFILQPEFAMLIIAAFNIFIGRYAGLRLMEWIRFRSILE